MKKVLVLGIGSRLMMDDGIGVHIVEELGKRKTDTEVCYIAGETDVSFCMQQIEEDFLVIIIDAACLGKEPGTIYTIPLKQVLEGPQNTISFHEFDLFRQLKIDGKNIRGILIGIEPYEISCGVQLSDALQEKFEDIVNIVGTVIESIRGA